MLKKSVMVAMLAVSSSALGWTTLQPRVEAGGAEYWIESGRLVYNGTPTNVPASFVGICESGAVWVLQRLAYGPRSWRWGEVQRGNFAEDPLMDGSPTVRWSQSYVPEC